MRVIYLHQYFNTPEMAGGTRSYEMARRLVAAGHQVDLVTTWREPSEKRSWFITQEAGITVHWLPVAYSNHMTYARRIRAFAHFAFASIRRALALAGDVVLATSTPLTIAIPGIVVSRIRRIPLVFEVRDLWPEVPVAMGILSNPLAVRASFALERLAYRLSARVITIAPGMKASVVKRGVPESAVSVIPNGCDLDLFARSAGPVTMRAAIQPGDRIVVYCGTMGEANGVDFIPRLAGELAARRAAPAIHFLLLGDGSRRGIAEEEAKRRGVLDRSVHFLGARPKREIADWLAAADAAIVTAAGPDIVFRDAAPNKFFDAIAAGKPVIANYSGFATAAAVEAGAGFIVSQDPERAAAQVLELLQNSETLARAGRAATLLARGRFSRDRLASQLEQVLLEAVRAGAKGAEMPRALTCFLTLSALLMLSPVMVVVAVLVWLSLGRPILFRQVRAGLRGKPFVLFKFRTLSESCDTAGALLPDANRLGPIGRFLRATSLDELPELINVLRGDMNLVGPRPLLMEYLPLYTAEQARRHDVLPGITGWAQVNGRNALSWEDKFRLDAWYVEHRSLRLDFRILCMTVVAVLSRKGVNQAGSATAERFTGSPQ